MAKIAMPVTNIDLDAPPAEHFAKARWFVLVEAPDRCEFLRTAELHGRAVVEKLAARGCTDVVSRQVGCGAYAQLAAAGVRTWQADAGVTPRVVAERLASGVLRPLSPDDCGGHPGRPATHGLGRAA